MSTAKIIRTINRSFPSCIVTKTNGGHLRIWLPNGRSVFAPSTPSDVRAMRNIFGQIRRGIQCPGQ